MKRARTPFTVSAPSICHYFILAVIISLYSHYTAADEAPKKSASEKTVKTAMMYNIIRFTEWPYNSEDIRLCLLGSGEQARALTTINEKQASGRTIRIKPRISPEYMTRECDALYISSTAKQQLPHVLKLLKDNPVLTLSDMDHFAEQGGMIDLYRNNGRIAFAINLNAVLNAGLMVNSQILKLARIVDK